MLTHYSFYLASVPSKETFCYKKTSFYLVMTSEQSLWECNLSVESPQSFSVTVWNLCNFFVLSDTVFIGFYCLLALHSSLYSYYLCTWMHLARLCHILFNLLLKAQLFVLSDNSSCILHE